MRASIIASAALALIACDDKPAATIAGAQTGTTSAPQPAGTVLVMAGDIEKQVPLVVDNPVSLATLLPEGLREPRRWKLLVASAHDGRKLAIKDWIQTHEPFRAMLFVDAGKPAFGVFPRAAGGESSKPRDKLTNLELVAVYREMPTAKGKVRHAVLVHVGDEVHRVTDVDLAAVEKVEVGRRGGYRLRDVLALVVPLADIATITVVGESTRKIDAAALADEAKVPVLRFSRRGEVSITTFEPATPSKKAPRTEVRRIDVTVKRQ